VAALKIDAGACCRAAGALESVGRDADAERSVIESCAGDRRSRRERDDDYRQELVRLNACWRVILCADAHQWILQRARTGRQRRPEWRASRYFRTRKALLEACAALCGPCDPCALERLAELPEVVR
jgi:hypothetical protein